MAAPYRACIRSRSLLFPTFGDKPERIRTVLIQSIQIITAQRQDQTENRRQYGEKHPSPSALRKGQHAYQAPAELPEKTTNRMDSADSNSSCLQQKTNTAGCESKEIVRLLMLLPHMRNHEMDHAAALQHSMKLFNDVRRLRRVFQNNNGQDVIEGGIRKRQLLEPADDIKPGVVPGRISLREVQGDVIRVLEEWLEPALTGTGIKYVFAGLDLRRDTAYERLNGCFERI